MSLRTGIVIGAVVAVILAVVLLLLNTQPARATSEVDPDVTIVCSGWTGVSVHECREWGDEIIGQGAPSFRFEMDDLVRLELDRPTFGLSGECTAEYFIGRYPDEAVWTEGVACR